MYARVVSLGLFVMGCSTEPDSVIGVQRVRGPASAASQAASDSRSGTAPSTRVPVAAAPAAEAVGSAASADHCVFDGSSAQRVLDEGPSADTSWLELEHVPLARKPVPGAARSHD
jgi:hypothetical protein